VCILNLCLKALPVSVYCNLMTKAKMQNVRKHIKVLILQIVCAFNLNTSKRLEKSLNKHLATCLYDDDDNDDDVNDDANDDNTM